LSAALNIDNQTYFIMDNLFKFIYIIDEKLVNLGCFHIVHYPKIVREKCYLCKTLKPEAVNKQATALTEIVSNDIPRLFDKGNKYILHGAAKINEASKIVPREPTDVPVPIWNSK